MIKVDIFLSEDQIVKEFMNALENHDLPEKFFYWFPLSIRAWINLCGDGAYRNYVRSHSVLHEHAVDLVSMLPSEPIELISLGAGQGTKDFLIMNQLKKQGKYSNYIPVDASQGLLEIACKSAQDKNFACRGIKADLNNDAHLFDMQKILELFLYRNSSAVVCLTHAFKANLVSRGIPEGQVAVVLNGVDLWRYGPRARDPELAKMLMCKGRFVVGYVGTHGMAHGLENVLKAANLLSGREDIIFLFVGAGSERAKLVSDAESDGLENVIFMPSQPKERVPAVWSLCNVALVHLRNLSVFRDVIPSKMFEAMGMGLPILLSLPEGEASAILKKSGAGFHIPPGDPVALAKMVVQLADDKNLCRNLGNNSLLAAPKHSRETQAAHMISVLEAVTMGKSDRVAQISIPDLN